MVTPFHPLNWQVGWLLILASFATGAAIGLFFHRDDFLGGYQSFPRRLLRLGHIALAALGAINILFSLSPWPVATTWLSIAASSCFIVGAVAMPSICFLTAWRRPFRHLFAVPVVALVLAALFTYIGGLS